MRLRHIEVFNAIMLTGSVSAAARLINVTQPAVSRVLQHAEIQLGFALFQRVKGRLEPTEEAQTLYPYIERLFAQLDEVQRLAASLRADAGRHKGLHVLTVLAFSHEVLPRALRLFRERHPQVPVTVQALHSPQIVSALALQEADIGYLFSAMSHTALVQEHLADRRMMCVAPKGLLKPRQLRDGSIGLAELARLPLIGLDVSDPLGTTLSQVFREAGIGLAPLVTVQTYHAALAMAHHGLGAALLDSCTTASADQARVDVLALEPVIPVRVTAIRPARRPHSQITRAMTRCVQAALAEIA